MNAFIRLLYALLIAVAVAVFIGVGIVSFYSPPKAPPFPAFSYGANVEDSSSSRTSKYEADQKQYKKDMKDYQRNVTLMVLPLATIVTVGGLAVMRRPGVIGEGLALGGIMTLVYGLITASIAGSDALRFIAVTLLLAGVLLTSQLRFGNPPKFTNQHAKFLGKLLNR